MKEERFTKAQIGDAVYCDMLGDGIIARIDAGTLFVSFHVGIHQESFKLNGYVNKVSLAHNKPCLFYRKGEAKDLTERPDQDIDWYKEEFGQKFEVSNDRIYYFERVFMGIIGGNGNGDAYPVFHEPSKGPSSGIEYRAWCHIRRIEDKTT